MNHFWRYQDDSFFNRCRKCGCNRVMNNGSPERFVYYYDAQLKPIYNNPICSQKKQKNEKVKDRVGKATPNEKEDNYLMGCD